MTETESPNIFGREIIATFTYANAESKGIVTNLIRVFRAIAILFLKENSPTAVRHGMKKKTCDRYVIDGYKTNTFLCRDYL